MEKLLKILSDDRGRLFISIFYWKLDRQQVWDGTVLWEYHVYVTEGVRHGGHKHQLDVWHSQRIPVPRQVTHFPVLFLSFSSIAFCNIPNFMVLILTEQLLQYSWDMAPSEISSFTCIFVWISPWLRSIHIIITNKQVNDCFKDLVYALLSTVLTISMWLVILHKTKRKQMHDIYDYFSARKGSFCTFTLVFFLI